MKYILLLLLPIFFSCNDLQSKKEEPKVEVDTVIESNSLRDSGSEVIEPSIESTETPVDLESNPPRYWYVCYSARKKSDGSEWRGYKVIQINESYFDVYEAIKIIYPNWTDGDYIGIEFFKEVSEKTYVEFNRTESPK